MVYPFRGTYANRNMFIAGAKGDKGDPGGPQGEQGEQGPQGPPGEDGKDGAQGHKGDKGDQGDQGPRGYQGAPGPTGPQGPQGLDGPRGPEGHTGPTGPKGDLTLYETYYELAEGESGGTIDGGGSVDLTDYATITYVDSQDAATLAASKAYTDSELQEFADNNNLVYLGNFRGAVPTDRVVMYVGTGTPSDWVEVSSAVVGALFTSTTDGGFWTKGNDGWSLTVGEEGPEGPEGQPGPQGDKGDDGAKGDTGDKGDQGEKGEKGDQGEKGDKGDKGDSGAAGVNKDYVDGGDLFLQAQISNSHIDYRVFAKYDVEYRDSSYSKMGIIWPTGPGVVENKEPKNWTHINVPFRDLYGRYQDDELATVVAGDAIMLTGFEFGYAYLLLANRDAVRKGNYYEIAVTPVVGEERADYLTGGFIAICEPGQEDDPGGDGGSEPIPDDSNVPKLDQENTFTAEQNIQGEGLVVRDSNGAAKAKIFPSGLIKQYGTQPNSHDDHVVNRKNLTDAINAIDIPDTADFVTQDDALSQIEYRDQILLECFDDIKDTLDRIKDRLSAVEAEAAKLKNYKPYSWVDDSTPAAELQPGECFISINGYLYMSIRDADGNLVLLDGSYDLAWKGYCYYRDAAGEAVELFSVTNVNVHEGTYIRFQGEQEVLQDSVNSGMTHLECGLFI